MAKGTHRLESGDVRGFVVRGDAVDYHPSMVALNAF
jgi:hypothetical protein